MKINKNIGSLMLLLVAIFGANMGSTDIRGDSMNYASISKNVLTAADPMILSLNGEIYMNKPPLFFWVNALFIKLFGAVPFSVKLSTLLAAMLIGYFLYKIAMELFEDSNTAILLPILLFSTYIVYKNTHMLKFEAFVTAFMTGAIYFYIKYLKDGRLIYVLLIGVFSGLAVFSKGPLGLVPLIGMGLFPFIDRTLLSFKYYKHFFLIFIITLAVPGWWFAYVMAHTPFFETFFLSQIVDRVGNNSLNLTGATYKVRPVWAYLEYILKYGGLFLIFFPYGIYKIRRDGVISSGLKYVILTGVIYTVIIHFISTREQRYLYQFYVFFWVIGAYGLGSMIKRDVAKYVKYAAIALLLFITIYPGELNWSTYGVLQEVSEISHKRHTPVVVRDEYITDKSDKAAVNFYLDKRLSEPPVEGNWIEVVHNSNKLDGGTEIFRTRRLSVYVMNGN
jgi:4-amino-4-deoxy-L-arabinose transferase-like glycosyltransferase